MFRLLVSILVVDVVVLFVVKYFPDLMGKPINDWYNQFGINAVLSDVFSIALVFLVTRFLYTTFVTPRFGFNFWVFLLLLVTMQILHDLFFYFAVIQPLPTGHNTMIDLFKIYAKTGRGVILPVDSLMMISSACLTSFLTQLPMSVSIFTGCLAVYTVPYILSTRNRFSDVLS